MISIVVVAATVAACGSGPDDGAGAGSDRPAPERLGVEIVEVLPHDPNAFTQGLELAGDTLYESTGLVGESTLRAGPVAGEPTAVAPLEEPLFGEGLTVVGDRVWQLTWRSGVAIEWDRQTLTERRRVRYSGEGWGLCHQPGRDRLVASDGSPTLTFRDPDDFSRLGSITVTDSGSEVDELNELECVGDEIYANVWHSDDILRIDPETGEVTARIDASGLLDPAERQEADVLNGIAAYGDSGYFLLTGKLWPKMFKVRWAPSG